MVMGGMKVSLLAWNERTGMCVEQQERLWGWLEEKRTGGVGFETFWYWRLGMGMV